MMTEQTRTVRIIWLLWHRGFMTHDTALTLLRFIRTGKAYR